MYAYDTTVLICIAYLISKEDPLIKTVEIWAHEDTPPITVSALDSMNQFDLIASYVWKIIFQFSMKIYIKNASDLLCIKTYNIYKFMK